MRRRGWRRVGSTFLSMELTVGLIPSHARAKALMCQRACKPTDFALVPVLGAMTVSLTLAR